MTLIIEAIVIAVGTIVESVSSLYKRGRMRKTATYEQQRAALETIMAAGFPVDAETVRYLEEQERQRTLYLAAAVHFRNQAAAQQGYAGVGGGTGTQHSVLPWFVLGGSLLAVM